VTLKASSPAACPPPTGSPFLDWLPLDVRYQIYKMLLVSPLLADPKALIPRPYAKCNQHFNLHPELLRVCRKIYNEASIVLYETNTFALYCLADSYESRSEWSWTKFSSTPLTRYRAVDNFEEVPALLKVRRWKIIVSPFVGHCHPPITICTFAHAARAASIKSLDIQVESLALCEGWGSGRKRYYPCLEVRRREPWSLATILTPLKLLRGLQRFVIIRDNIQEDVRQLESRLWSLTMSDIPPVCVIDMYRNLLVYAQAFERNEIYKKDMATKDKITWHCEFKRRHADAINRYEKDGLPVMELKHFKTRNMHPVEQSLEVAKCASDVNDRTVFETQRKIVVDFLEPQYQRIRAARDLLKDFMFSASHSMAGYGKHLCIREIDVYKEDDLMAYDLCLRGIVIAAIRGTLLLESYAKAFIRDLTPEIEIVIRLH
jgi:hypothetical protein